VLLGVLREGGVAARALRSCQRGWLHGAARVVVLGRCMREHLGAAYGLPADKVAVIPIGSDPDEITPLAREDSAFRREHGLQDDFVVLYSGNFGRYHNFDAILDAAKQLGASAPRVRFVLVGGGAQRERIERRVADEGIVNVLLLPFVSRRDFPDMLAAADASLVTLEPGMEGLCVPSKFYSLLASGRPVIALMGERCEVARVLAEEGCGVRADAGDAGALAGAVLAMLSDQGRARSMGDRARAALEARFSCGEVAARYFETMHAAAGTTAPPARAAVPTPSNETAVGATAVANAAPRKNMESVTS